MIATGLSSSVVTEHAAGDFRVFGQEVQLAASRRRSRQSSVKHFTFTIRRWMCPGTTPVASLAYFQLVSLRSASMASSGTMNMLGLRLPGDARLNSHDSFESTNSAAVMPESPLEVRSR